jgi:hypothetical protein
MQQNATMERIQSFKVVTCSMANSFFTQKTMVRFISVWKLKN